MARPYKKTIVRTAEAQRVYLEALPALGFRAAAAAAGVTDLAVERWRSDDRRFSSQYDAAAAAMKSRLERVLHGIAAGDIEASGSPQITALVFALRAADPERYGTLAPSSTVVNVAAISSSGDPSRAATLLAQWSS